MNNATEFIKISHQFRLGELPTEQFNPKTIGLAEDAKQNLYLALARFKEVDLDALNALLSVVDKLEELHSSIKRTLKSGQKVFISGCGATGRLGLSVETLWRKLHQNDEKLKEQVVSFMAGGDLALIHSLESFEDHPEYGSRQLKELGYKKEDLVIGVTEGGETPFVIGSVEEAAVQLGNTPFILYCNPDDVLSKVAKRSEKFIQNPTINNISIPLAPMALAGSTRLQATTVLQLALGLSLVYFDDDFSKVELHLKNVISSYQKLDVSELAEFIKWESEIYRNEGFLNFLTNADLAMVLLTDTTERSPTFTLPTFENFSDKNKAPSLCYLGVKGSQSPKEVWNEVLMRAPRTLEWEELKGVASLERLYGFDISERVLEKRASYLENSHFVFVDHDNDTFKIETGESSFHVRHHVSDLFDNHIILKMVMNMASTLVMARIGRFQSNVMTYVKPSNNKLIDRSARYIDLLLKQQNILKSYEEIIEEIFQIKDRLNGSESIVLKVVESFTKA